MDASEWKPKKNGLNDGDVWWLVRLMRAGKSWEEARAALAPTVIMSAIEAWKDEVLLRAGIAPAKPPPQPKPAAPPPIPLTATVRSSRKKGEN